MSIISSCDETEENEKELKLRAASGPPAADGIDDRGGPVFPLPALATGCGGEIGNGEIDAVVALKEISEDER